MKKIPDTDAQGRVTSQQRYFPYGEPRAGGHGSSPTDFGFTAQRNEASFGLMDYNARYYSPVLGRFVSPDSIVPEPSSSGGFNRYRYVRNNPLRYSDPTGHQCAECLLFEEAVRGAQSIPDPRVAVVSVGVGVSGGMAVALTVKAGDMASSWVMQQELQVEYYPIGDLRQAWSSEFPLEPQKIVWYSTPYNGTIQVDNVSTFPLELDIPQPFVTPNETLGFPNMLPAIYQGQPFPASERNALSAVLDRRESGAYISEGFQSFIENDLERNVEDFVYIMETWIVEELIDGIATGDEILIENHYLQNKKDPNETYYHD